MQQKQRYLTRRNLIGVATAAIVIVIGVLMTTTIPAPVKPMEKELDAKAFFEPKPPQ